MDVTGLRQMRRLIWLVFFSRYAVNLAPQDPAVPKIRPVGQAFQPAGSLDFPVECSVGRLESRPNRQTRMSALPGCGS
jgi:hypothetical protein